MSHTKTRTVTVRITSRKKIDPDTILKTIREALQGAGVDVRVQAQPDSAEADTAGAVELPPILRDKTLSADEAEIIKNILDDPNQPTHAGREMETGDASILLRKLG